MGDIRNRVCRRNKNFNIRRHGMSERKAVIDDTEKTHKSIKMLAG